MIDDTRIGGASSKFPSTRRSAVIASGSAEPEERRQALERIVAAYWKPVYKFIRLRWPLSNEDAKDLTQAFFARAIEKQFFKAYEPQKASFRTFLRSCVTHFVINESKHARRLKRGGDAIDVSIDQVEEPSSQTLEEFFEKEWIRSVFDLALDDLRKLCEVRSKAVHFSLFEQYDLNHTTLTYDELAEQHGLKTTDVTNYLAWCRREFRRLLLQTIRGLTSNDEDFRRECNLVLNAKQ